MDTQWWLSCQSGWDWGGCPGSIQLHKCIFTGAAAARATGAVSTPSTDRVRMQRCVWTQTTALTVKPQAVERCDEGLRKCKKKLHVVHYNSELYPSVSTAMTQRDGLVVLGVLIVTGEETNVAFNNILNYLSRVRHADQKVSIPAFDIQSLLPTDLGSYYRYNGSLTTPPCYQSVAWIVFNERVQISKAQLLKMETLLYSTRAEDEFRILLQDNYRVTQPLNHRVVFTSFSAESGKELTSGEVTAIVIGVMCGCVGLAVIVRFVVKTIRFFKLLHQETVVVNSSTSSWDVLPSNRPAPMPRVNEPKKANDKKQDVALNSTSDSEKKEEPLPPPQTEP
ncbi:carbonic anhydrase 14 isoform X7 [Betta splendens]|uniref:Carbonic anhydrase 14 isoform X7 n=1 Tax=Betta splendens TaxID=158456 RepID=A0A6P7KVB4_BETSP|nr:carbonic anhydrase 14 isoform X7 [Betta splendens]XP_040923546.1 carbonic anhydrase 14 isoform X7 [Betta splendens]